MSAPKPVWAIVPTFNEAETIEPLARAVLEALPANRRLLVVDDASPDGTGRIAERLGDELGDVEVLHRPEKLGIGPAYLAGFARALDADAERVVQMDADFSHDPADLPRLLDATGAADLAIGSRYAPGGRILDWGAGRLAISRWGSAYARTVLGLEVRDMTSGFKCWRRATLEAIDLGSVATHGYAFQVEMTFRAVRAGLEVVEVPITFRDRRVGESKMTGSIVVEAALTVPRLRLTRRG